jgi:hypothetical protein
MIYSINYYLLLENRSDNDFSVDGLVHPDNGERLGHHMI